MTSPAQPVRGFDWKLAPLQRKLEWEVDEARTLLARVLAQWHAADEAMRHAESQLQEASQEARSSVVAQADPRAHRRQLAWLVSLADAAAAAAHKERQAGEELAAARQDMLQRQRRLDVLLKARENAFTDHLHEQSRVAQNEADAGWLALRQSRPMRAGREGQA